MTSKKAAGFSVAVSIAFCVNYIIGLCCYIIKTVSLLLLLLASYLVTGSGSLAIPKAFHQSGSLLGVIVMVVTSFFSISATLFLLETMARAEALYSVSKSPVIIDEIELAGNSDDKIKETTPLNSNSDNYYSTFSDFNEKENKRHELSQNNNEESDQYIVKDRKFEISELCDIFIGPFYKRLYLCVLSTYLGGCCWSYGTVFANSLSSLFHEYLPLYFRPYSYPIFLSLYSLIVIPISCLELTEQVYLQVTLSLCRICMMLVMISTIILADFSHNQPFQEFPREIEHDSLLRIDLSLLYIILPIAAYANIFHHSLPALSQPVQNKKNLVFIYLCTIFLCLIAYCSIGCIISSYFGSYIKSSSNLNWISYSGFSRVELTGNGSNDSHNTDSTSTVSNTITHITIPSLRRLQEHLLTSVPTYAKLISTYVVCFPGLDVSSAFPLCAITLGNEHDSISKLIVNFLYYYAFYR